MSTTSAFPHQGSLAREEPLTASETWWIGKDRDHFYSIVRERAPMLSRRYGSVPVSVCSADPDSGFMARARNLRRAIREGYMR